MLSQVRASPQRTMDSRNRWDCSEFEPLLLTRKTGGLMRVSQSMYMMARIPVQWQTNYDAYINDCTAVSHEYLWKH